MDMFVRHMSIRKAAVGGVEILINRRGGCSFQAGSTARGRCLYVARAVTRGKHTCMYIERF